VSSGPRRKAHASPLHVEAAELADLRKPHNWCAMPLSAVVDSLFGACSRVSHQCVVCGVRVCCTWVPDGGWRQVSGCSAKEAARYSSCWTY